MLGLVEGPVSECRANMGALTGTLRHQNTQEHLCMFMRLVGAMRPMPGHLCTQSNCGHLGLLVNEVDRARALTARQASSSIYLAV